MAYSTAFSFSSVYSLGVCLSAAIRLKALCKFLIFLFASTAPPPGRNAFSKSVFLMELWRLVVASLSNWAVKANGGRIDSLQP